MKRVLLLLFLVTGLSLLTLGQNPIPSYNVPVFYRANFQEPAGTDVTRNMEKKSVHVVVGGSAGNMALVYLYTQDSATVLGPFNVFAGQSLVVEIDDRDWGVFVESEDHVTVDVWITTERTRIIPLSKYNFKN
ncbi:MAG TPA: hypothetical protein PKG48_05900 [Bacteroidales bacterium]|nr:hypothetical protein [Bacteroidales bacterium]HPS63048.1 hypothetical protein [Bacteroidales bacterium]